MPDGEPKAATGLHGLGSLLAGGVLVRAVSSFRVLLFAPLMGTEAFGAFRLAQTMTLIVAGAASLGLPTAHARFLPESSEAERPALARRLLQTALLCAAVVAAVLAIWGDRLAGYLFQAPGYEVLGYLLLGCLVATVALRSLVGIAQGMGRFGLGARGEVAQSIAALVVGLGLLAVFRFNAAAGMAAHLVSLLVGAVVLWKGLPGLATAGEWHGDMGRVLRYSSWFALIPITQYLFDFIDRWMIARHLSLDLAGAYSIAPALAGGMALFGNALGTMALQRGAGRWGAGDRKGAVEMVWSLTKLSVLASLCYCAALRVAEPAIWWAMGESWARAAVVLPVLLVYFSLFNAYWVIGSISALAERTWVNLLAGILGAAGTTFLCMMLVPRFGMIGAGWATLFGQVILLAVHVLNGLALGMVPPLSLWLLLGLAFVNLLPPVALVLVVALIVGLAVRSNLLLNASDRGLVLESFRRWRRAGAQAS